MKKSPFSRRGFSLIHDAHKAKRQRTKAPPSMMFQDSMDEAALASPLIGSGMGIKRVSGVQCSAQARISHVSPQRAQIIVYLDKKWPILERCFIAEGAAAADGKSFAIERKNLIN